MGLVKRVLFEEIKVTKLIDQAEYVILYSIGKLYTTSKLHTTSKYIDAWTIRFYHNSYVRTKRYGIVKLKKRISKHKRVVAIRDEWCVYQRWQVSISKGKTVEIEVCSADVVDKDVHWKY